MKNLLKKYIATWPKNCFYSLNKIVPFQERILQLLFLLVETINEIRKNQIFEK